MGTRNLTAVVLDGQFRIAQYGQWDGYPSGQGDTVLQFLSGWDRSKFEDSLRKSRFAEKSDYDRWEAEGKTIQDLPHLSRDRGAEILQIVQDSNGDILLKNQLSFAGDSLFCEWAYLLDLDQNQLEVYRGFQKAALEDGQRFKDMDGLEVVDGYFPIRMVKAYPLDELPTVEQMQKDCCPSNEE